MKPEVWASLEAGGVVLCAQARLARELRAEHDARQQAAGRGAWAAAAIIPLEGWLERAWGESGGRLLLSGEQELRLWELVIAADLETGALLPLAATAETAAAGWKLAQAWGAPWAGGEWEESEDTAAFRRWALRLRADCARAGWITAAELAGEVAAGLRAGAVAAPAQVWLAGFDALTPRQQELVEALRGAGSVLEAEAEAEAAAVEVVVAADREDELAQAAGWARGLVEAGAAGPIAIVVPDLRARRGAVERHLQEALHPGRAPWDEGPRAFHISLGQALAAVPLVAAALQALAVWTEAGAVGLEAALPWLRSPFTQGAERERGARAELERALRRRERGRWSWPELRRMAAAGHCPELVAAITAAQRARDAWPQRQNQCGWAASFAALWQAMGWPGERPLGSAEFQAVEAWVRLREEWAGLDEVAPAAEAAEAAGRRLQQMAQRRVFQPQAGRAPVQAMGWLEAAGQRFSHLWVAGLDDAAVPAAAAPHPFLPLGWQRAQGLPRSTAAREVEFAARIWQRLRQSAGEVVASHAARAGDEQRRPSPLLEGCARRPAAARPPRLAAALEAVADEFAPPLPPGASPGGSDIFQEQLACPFRAAVHLRLGARAAPAIPLGLPRTRRGVLLHAVLAGVWAHLEGSAGLQACSDQQLEAVIAARVAAVVAQEAGLRAAPGLAALERERLQDTVRAWLEVEKQRAPFRTLRREAREQVQYGGLELELRLDRVDELEAGGLALIDYKSGVVSARDWREPRMREPQLPLYWATHPERERVEVVAWAQVRPGEMRFQGKERRTGALLERTLDRSHGALPWSEETGMWEASLAAAAEGYRRGVANVDPLDASTCHFCDLAALCRIRAPGGATAEDEDGDGDGDGDGD